MSTQAIPEANPRPRFTQEEAARLAREHYGLEGDWLELPSERDRHWRLTAPQGVFVLKISGAAERRELLECQHAALDWIAERDPELAIPRVLPTLAGERLAHVESAEGTPHWLRLLSWLPGVPLARVSPHGPELREQVGRLV